MRQLLCVSVIKEKIRRGKEGARRDNKEKIYLSVTQIRRKLAGDVAYRIASVFSGQKQLICSYMSGEGKCSLSSSLGKYNTGSLFPIVWLNTISNLFLPKVFCSTFSFIKKKILKSPDDRISF